MEKIKFTEQIALQIIENLFCESGKSKFDENDLTVPREWRNKTVVEALNVKYYTFKHRPLSTTQIILAKINQSNQSASTVNELGALTRSFCLLYLGQIKRVYSKDTDMLEVPVNLEFWVQSSKVQLLENLISQCNIDLIGERITVNFGENKTRRIAMQFGNLINTDVLTGTPCGEMVSISCECSMVISPNIASYSDYLISVEWEDSERENIPLFSFQVERIMTPKSVPYINNPRTTGNINLSNAKTFTLGFYGYNDSRFVKEITKDTISDDSNAQDRDVNNKLYKIIITRSSFKNDESAQITGEFVVSRHTINVEPGTGYETHTVTLALKGMR